MNLHYVNYLIPFSLSLSLSLFFSLSFSHIHTHTHIYLSPSRSQYKCIYIYIYIALSLVSLFTSLYISVFLWVFSVFYISLVLAILSTLWIRLSLFSFIFQLILFLILLTWNFAESSVDKCSCVLNSPARLILLPPCQTTRLGKYSLVSHTGTNCSSNNQEQKKPNVHAPTALVFGWNSCTELYIPLCFPPRYTLRDQGIHPSFNSRARKNVNNRQA